METMLALILPHSPSTLLLITTTIILLAVVVVEEMLVAGEDGYCKVMKAIRGFPILCLVFPLSSMLR